MGTEGTSSGASTGSGAGGSEAGDGSGNTGQSTNSGIPPAGNQNGGNSGSSDIQSLLSRISQLEEQTKEIPKLRQEAAKYRTRLKALASDEEEPKGGNQASGADTAIMAQLSKLREGRIRDQIALSAEKAGALAPSEVYRYFDFAEIANEEGTVDKPEKLMADLRKQYPFLFKAPVEGSADANVGSGANAKPGDMNSIIRQGFRSMRGGS